MAEIKEGTEFKGFWVSSRVIKDGKKKFLVCVYPDDLQGLTGMRAFIKILQDKGYAPSIEKIHLTL